MKAALAGAQRGAFAGARRGWHWLSRHWLGRHWLGRELLLLAAFAVVYAELHDHMVQAAAVATRHALGIVSAEQALGLFQEERLQDVFLHIPGVMRSFNLYYGGTHFLVPAGALIWLAIRHPDRYARARTTLAAITGLGFLSFWLYPVAPPRLLPARYGIVDTLLTLGHAGHVASTLIGKAGDSYASMPSLHVAWALWTTLALYPVIRHRLLRGLAIAYPLMTTLVVVTTGNHFFADALAGAALAAVTWAVVAALGRSRPDGRPRTPGGRARRAPSGPPAVPAPEPAADRTPTRVS